MELSKIEIEIADLESRLSVLHKTRKDLIENDRTEIEKFQHELNRYGFLRDEDDVYYYFFMDVGRVVFVSEHGFYWQLDNEKNDELYRSKTFYTFNEVWKDYVDKIGEYSVKTVRGVITMQALVKNSEVFEPGRHFDMIPVQNVIWTVID